MEVQARDRDVVACTWQVEESDGLETAWVTLDGGRMAARGRAVGLTPYPYWVAYSLETGDRQVTRRLAVQVESAAGTRITGPADPVLAVYAAAKVVAASSELHATLVGDPVPGGRRRRRRSWPESSW